MGRVPPGRAIRRNVQAGWSGGVISAPGRRGPASGGSPRTVGHRHDERPAPARPPGHRCAESGVGQPTAATRARAAGAGRARSAGAVAAAPGPGRSPYGRESRGPITVRDGRPCALLSRAYRVNRCRSAVARPGRGAARPPRLPRTPRTASSSPWPGRPGPATACPRAPPYGTRPAGRSRRVGEPAVAAAHRPPDRGGDGRGERGELAGGGGRRHHAGPRPDPVDLAAVRDLGGTGTPVILAGPDGVLRAAVPAA